MTWTWESLSPGITRRPSASTTRVPGPISAAMSRSSPTAVRRPAVTASASACGRAGSPVWIRPLRRIRSAVVVVPGDVTAVALSGGPRRLERPQLGHHRRDVVGGPLLADLAIGDPVDVDGVPPDRLAVGRDAQQAALDRGGDDEPDDDQVVLGDDVLLGRVQVRHRADERVQ